MKGSKFLQDFSPRLDGAETEIYAFYTPRAPFATPFLCGGFDNTHRCNNGVSQPMDVIYLLFSFVLCAASIGFLMICDRLGRRP